MMLTGAGLLRERVRFERRVNSLDGYGNTVSSWNQLVGPVAARIKPLRGGEKVMAQRLESVVTVEITVRKSSDTIQVTEADRAIDVRSGDEFNIKAVVNPDERGRYLTFTATRGDVSG